MNIFQNVTQKAQALLSDWVQINDDKSPWTIEDFAYTTGVIEQMTKPHCWRCVTVNKCWFANEAGKKPVASEVYSNENSGLYHPNCHCYEKAMLKPSIDNITFQEVEMKSQWFFKDKLGWYLAWGYRDTEEEKRSFIANLLNLSAKAYCNGEYEIEKHDKYGVHVNLFVGIPGQREKSGRVYSVKTCFMIFPNGKLKCNTVIGDRA